ncbi:hypothetical protein M9Y10_014103 [Tritrichomonas musculus]|uniref:Uncharacterized protein n=1 Tax=Tritrichomonas musculus TaxID=1915356 RepID=A0ABR2KZF6_9EUKA
MQEDGDFLDQKDNNLNTNDGGNDDVVSMEAFKQLAQKVDQMEKQINDLEEENKKLKQNQEENNLNQETTPALPEAIPDAAQALIGTIESKTKEEDQSNDTNTNETQENVEKNTDQEDVPTLQGTIPEAAQELIETIESKTKEEDQPNDTDANETQVNDEDATNETQPLSTAVENLTGALINKAENLDEEHNNNAEEQENNENEQENANDQENQEETQEAENKNVDDQENQQENGENEPEVTDQQLNPENSNENAEAQENQEGNEENQENTEGNEENQANPEENQEGNEENQENPEGNEENPVNSENPEQAETDNQENENKQENDQENTNDENKLQEISDNIQKTLFNTENMNDVKEPDENDKVFVDEKAKEYTYDTEKISISEEFDIHQQYLLNHVINIQILPNQTEPTRCLFSATTDTNVFDSYCKYLKLNNVVTFHFSSKPTDDGTDNYFSFCTGRDLVTLVNPTEDHIKFALKSFKETYVIPCSLEDKEQLNSYESIPAIERYATNEMINYVNDQINEQKNTFKSELFEYEKPLTYSSFLNTSIDSYFGYLASHHNDEFERIIVGKHEYTHEREKCSLFDRSFNLNNLLGINNVCEIELSPNKYVKCLFSATEDNVLENYLSLIQFEKVVSYHFSSSPNGHVNYFSFCSGEDLIVLINPPLRQLNIVLNKIKKFYLVPCGLNDRSQLFFYDYLNKVQNIATDKDVKLIAEEIDQIQKSPYSRYFSYDISSSYEKFMHIAYTTFLGYLVRWQFLETVCTPTEFTSYSVSDFIPLRRLDYGKTFALNWQEGKVYVLKKFRDLFKFNQALYLYKTKKMSRIIPFFGEARNDEDYLVFGFGSRGTLKEVASSQYLDIATCRKIAIQLVFTLAYFHMTEMKPCAITNDHISLDWNYNVFLTDFDDSERVFNITPEQLDINNLGNALHTLVTGETSSFNPSKSIPSIYAPIGRIFELCKKQGTTACDLVLEILNDRDFSKEKVLIDNLLNELPQQFDGSIDIFDDLSYKYFKINCKEINQSTINFIKTLKFGPITTFQIISDEDEPIENRMIVFETNHICGFLKNVPPSIINILISKMKNSEVVPVTKEDLDLLFEYYKFDQLRHFLRDPQLSVYRENAKQVLQDMDDIKDKFVLGETLALSIAISHPSKVKIITAKQQSLPPQFPHISLVDKDSNLHAEMPSNQLKIIEILKDYVLTCLYSTEQDYTFNEFVAGMKRDKFICIHFSEDGKEEFVSFCGNNKLLLIPTKKENDQINNQVNKVIDQIKAVKVYGVGPDDRSHLFNFTNFDLIDSFANQNEMNELLNRVESSYDEIITQELNFDKPPMTYSTFLKHSGQTIAGYYLLKNPEDDETKTQISASFEPSISFGTSFEKVLENSFKPKEPKSFSITDEETDWKKALNLYNLAAERNDPAAFFNLGLMHSTGQGVPKDKEKAAEYYRKAADLGNQKAQFNLGLMYYKGEGVPEDKAEAARLYQLAADQGNAKAQSNLGCMYHKGDGVEQNYEKAVELYEKAVAQNDPDAQLNLGLMCEQGQGTPVDKERVVDLYTKSAENGNAKAQFNLGVLYHNGIKGILEKNNKKAIHYYSLAAEQGIAKAQFNLGVLFSKGDTDVPVDKKRAVHLLQLAADQGDEDAQLNLGAMYAKGEGVSEPDKKKTCELYKKAAKQGNPKAQYNLAVMYSKGDGVDKNNKKAAKYYQKAADQDLPQAAFNLGVLYFKGSPELPADKEKAAELFEKTTVLNPNNSKALYNLAIMHMKGEGVEKDEVKAREYFEKAAQLNNKDALLNLGLMYYEGTAGVRKDKTMAFDCYKRSADLGNDKAQLNLALMCQKGEGCDIDKEMAKKYFQLAADQGNTQAQINLGLLLLGGDEDDQDKAKQYLNEAAKEGNVDAMVGLAKRYQLDDETESAIKWYTRAANHQNAQAQMELGTIYMNGDGTDVDLEKAEEFLNKSLENKSDEALLHLGELYEKKGDTQKANEFYHRALDAGVDGANEKINRLNQDSTSEPFKEEEQAPQNEEEVPQPQNNEEQTENQNEEVETQNEEVENHTEEEIEPPTDNLNEDEIIPQAEEVPNENSEQAENANSLHVEVIDAEEQNRNEVESEEQDPAIKARNVIQKPDDIEVHFEEEEEEGNVEEDEEEAEPEDQQIGRLYNTLEARIKTIHDISNEAYKDPTSALKDIHDNLISKGLNDCLKTYYKMNRLLQITEDEIDSFLNQSQSNSSNLPSLNKDSNVFISLDPSNSGSEDEELCKLKSDVQVLETQIKQVSQQIRNSISKPTTTLTTTNKNNSSVHSSSTELPPISNPVKIAQPSEANTTISPRISTLSPRTTRNKIKILEKRVKQGDADAQYLLGACYALGQGVSQDKQKAVQYYTEAAEQGNLNATYALAACYSYGKGVAADKKKAFEFYLKAAKEGHDKSQFAVGHFYDFGQGILTPDHKMALEWYKKAAAQGHQPAIEMLRNESDTSNNE